MSGSDRLSEGRVQSFSLRTKLLVFATALVVIPGAITAAITVSTSRAAMTRVVGRQLVTEARNAADRLANTLRSERGRLRSLAMQDVMREIRIADLDKRIASFLVSAKQGCPACIDLFVLDGSGRVVASSDPAQIGEASPEIESIDPEGIRGPDPVGESAGPVVSIAVPVPDPDGDGDGDSLGRLVARLDWTRGTEVIARTRENLLTVGLDAHVLIVDEHGSVIGGAAPPGGAWPLGSTIDPGRRGARELATPRLASGMLFGEAPLPADLPRWWIVVAEPLDEALAPVRRTATLLGSALGATLLTALAIALFAARRVTRPLDALTRAAEGVARDGGPAPAVPVHSGDEIGTLTSAFNRMSVDLGRAQRELVEAAKFAFVGELAAGVAHEVRTPLGVLRSSAQLLERSLETDDEESRELCHLLREEVDRIERIVSGLLELGRPRELRPEPSPLGQTVFRAADFVEAQARESGIRLHRHAVDPEPWAMCDPELVYQVTLNLLVNAVQVLPPGGTIDVSVAPADDGFVSFEVRDDGPGMTEEVRARIFEPFFTRREGGGGLGLTFVQRVVQEHRGRIAVESAPGEGTSVRVALPSTEAAP